LYADVSKQPIGPILMHQEEEEEEEEDEEEE
jgi:hypothetical protein